MFYLFQLSHRFYIRFGPYVGSAAAVTSSMHRLHPSRNWTPWISIYSISWIDTQISQEPWRNAESSPNSKLFVNPIFAGCGGTASKNQKATAFFEMQASECTWSNCCSCLPSFRYSWILKVQVMKEAWYLSWLSVQGVVSKVSHVL